MYGHYIEDMMESLHKAEVVSDRKLAKEVLEQYWEDKIAVLPLSGLPKISIKLLEKT